MYWVKIKKQTFYEVKKLKDEKQIFNKIDKVELYILLRINYEVLKNFPNRPNHPLFSLVVLSLLSSNRSLISFFLLFFEIGNFLFFFSFLNRKLTINRGSLFNKKLLFYYY